MKFDEHEPEHRKALCFDLGRSRRRDLIFSSLNIKSFDRDPENFDLARLISFFDRWLPSWVDRRYIQGNLRLVNRPPPLQDNAFRTPPAIFHKGSSPKIVFSGERVGAVCPKFATTHVFNEHLVA